MSADRDSLWRSRHTAGGGGPERGAKAATDAAFSRLGARRAGTAIALKKGAPYFALETPSWPA